MSWGCALVRRSGPKADLDRVSAEAAMVLAGRRGEDAGRDLDLFLRRASVTTVSFAGEQLAIARLAFRRYKKGRHRAGLNFGDCAAFVA